MIIAVLVATLLLSLADVGAAQAPLSLSVRARDNRLSVDSNGVPISDILKEISRQTGIAVYVEQSSKARAAPDTLTIAFSDVPLEEGLRKLFRHKSFALSYSGEGLAEIRIYADGGTGQFDRVAVEPRGERSRRAARPAREKPRDEADIVRLRVEALENPSPTERATAMQALILSADQGAIRETALTLLERERDPEVLEEALDGLEAVGSIPIDPLLHFARNESAPGQLRLQALELVAGQGTRDPRVVEIVRQLARHRDQEVHESAQSLLTDLTD